MQFSWIFPKDQAVSTYAKYQYQVELLKMMEHFYFSKPKKETLPSTMMVESWYETEDKMNKAFTTRDHVFKM